MENTIVLNIVMITVETAAILAVGGKLIQVIKSLYTHQMAIGNAIQTTQKNIMLKENFFDLQARSMQDFLEQFLGKDFNIQCQYMKPVLGKDKIDPPKYQLWVWKRYETRDMGAVIQAIDIPSLIAGFMRIYYCEAYFTDAMAFPKD